MTAPEGWYINVPWTRAMRAQLPEMGDSTCYVRDDGILGAVETPSKPMDYRGQLVPHRHISIAVIGHERRPTDAELEQARRDFGMERAEEDNHSPGCARHLFLPLTLAPGEQSVCECKEDEEQVVESDGFRWSRKRVSP